MYRQLLILCICCFFSNSLFGQGFITDVSKSGTSVATFLEIAIGARGVAMGGANVSIANDATALYWNPAGITRLAGNDVVALHTRWIAGTNFDFLGIVVNMGNFGSLGFSFTALTMDDMAVRTVEMPDGTGEFFKAGDIAAAVSYARQLTNRFSIGLTAKFIQQNIWHESATGFALDAGTTFRTDLFGGMIIGASISNFGTKMQLSGRDTRLFGRIDESKLGSNERIPQNIELDSWHLPILFQFGVSTNLMARGDYQWIIAIDALHPSDNYESLNIGTEIGFRDFFFLRGGYQSLFLDEAEGGLSFGIGTKSKMLFRNAEIRADYAFRNMERLDSVHVFSLGLSF
ncbi:PorV/PorQ family protein [candidate division KSB1 bacterium]|nr:PorV/PorQ family protein [candidate division KSB1 bacterium]